MSKKTWEAIDGNPRVKMEMKEAIRLLNRAKSLLRHAHYNSREFDEHRKYLISSIEDFEERHDNDHIAYAGKMVSLRDYFAAQVIGPAFLDLFTGWRQRNEPVQEDWPLGLAIDAYRVADAMLKEREK